MRLHLFWLFVAGGCGTLSRYALGGLVQRYCGAGFPWGTAAINTVGCFAFGILWSAMLERGLIGPEARTVVLVGFLGAFTTFSTFVAESGQMIAEREMLIGLANIVFQVAAGLALFYLGQVLGRAI